MVQDSSGDIYLSSDLGIPAVYRISLKNSSEVRTALPAAAALSVNPNPTADRLTISLAPDMMMSHPQLQLIDALGITRKQFQPEDVSINLDVHDLPAGAYYLRLSTARATMTCPVMIVR